MSSGQGQQLSALLNRPPVERCTGSTWPDCNPGTVGSGHFKAPSGLQWLVSGCFPNHSQCTQCVLHPGIGLCMTGRRVSRTSWSTRMCPHSACASACAKRGASSGCGWRRNGGSLAQLAVGRNTAASRLLSQLFRQWCAHNSLNCTDAVVVLQAFAAEQACTSVRGDNMPRRDHSFHPPAQLQAEGAHHLNSSSKALQSVEQRDHFVSLQHQAWEKQRAISGQAKNSRNCRTSDVIPAMPSCQTHVPAAAFPPATSPGRPLQSSVEKRIFNEVAMPNSCSLAHILHFSQPTQSMMRVTLWNVV